MIDELVALAGLSQRYREETEGCLISDLHNYLHTIKQDNNDYRSSRLWSLCGYKCILDALSPETSTQVIPPRLVVRLGIGTYAHKLLQNDLLAKAGILWGSWECVHCGKNPEGKRSFFPKKKIKCSSEAFEYCELDYQEEEVSWPNAAPDGKTILGHVDGLIYENHRLESLGLMDIKTTTSKTFNYYLKEPDESHVYQVQIYMNLFKEEDIKWAVILYVNLENGEMKSFKVQKDVSFLEDAKKKIDSIKLWSSAFKLDQNSFAKEMQKELRNKKTLFDRLPPRACSSPNEKRSKFCPQSNLCWNTVMTEALINKLAGGDK